jgi:hypothetical protein
LLLPPDVDGPPTPRQYHIVGPRIKVEQVGQRKGHAGNRSRGKHGQAEKRQSRRQLYASKEASGKEARREAEAQGKFVGESAGGRAPSGV